MIFYKECDFNLLNLDALVNIKPNNNVKKNLWVAFDYELCINSLLLLGGYTVPASIVLKEAFQGIYFDCCCLSELGAAIFA